MPPRQARCGHGHKVCVADEVAALAVMEEIVMPPYHFEALRKRGLQEVEDSFIIADVAPGEAQVGSHHIALHCVHLRLTATEPVKTFFAGVEVLSQALHHLNAGPRKEVQ